MRTGAAEHDRPALRAPHEHEAHAGMSDQRPSNSAYAASIYWRAAGRLVGQVDQREVAGGETPSGGLCHSPCSNPHAAARRFDE